MTIVSVQLIGPLIAIPQMILAHYGENCLGGRDNLGGILLLHTRFIEQRIVFAGSVMLINKKRCNFGCCKYWCSSPH